MDRQELAKHLNSAQLQAACHVHGPLLILAGAGSGKTRVLTYRIAHLIACHGLDPRRILAITFTNKAAAELRQRVHDLLARQKVHLGAENAPWVGTFHALGSHILRRCIRHLPPYRPDFSIYDHSQQLGLVRDSLRQLQIDPNSLKPSAVLAGIGHYKSRLMSPEQVLEQARGDFYQERLAQVYRLYQERLQQQNALDFSDLLSLTLRLLRQNPQVLQHYQQRWEQVLIDEYQDTNAIQYHLVRMLCKHGNLCVVGDDDQSIYRWRGARLRNILDFEQDYPQAKLIKLEQNYRSTRNILKAANQVVANNKQRKQKRLWSELGEGEKLLCYLAADELEEAEFICRQIKSFVARNRYSYQEIALLYRTNAQSRTLEDALRREGIPHEIVGGLKFYERKEVKDLLAYLRLIHNSRDTVSLQRIINLPPRGLGRIALEKIEQFCRSRQLCWYEGIMCMVREQNHPVPLLKRLSVFIELIEGLKRDARELPLPGLLEAVIERSGYLRYLQGEPFQLESRRENISELVSACAEFAERDPGGGLDRFLEQVSLVSDVDLYNSRGAVTLMTLHSAKGLEFPVVFICGMEEKIFPHQLSLSDPAELEEERRLCYVGMTRAKERLFLTHVARRRLYGKVLESPPSRFLEEIPADCLERRVSARLESTIEIYDRAGGRSWSRKQVLPKDSVLRGAGAVCSEGSPPAPVYRVGMPVRHPKWGVGRICSLEGKGDRLKLVVDFWGNKKKLLAKFAHLEREA